ncbi:gp291 [Sphingomonas phage PAU]|uniref:gp291 n=1 Tax=Sphingomonas phage PAU TaxID=1150991 RepID=UPI00025734A2|nr:gp291 [Sphingomonas phage PAU]AFF28288.1 gp291 [Sphingomonas phage PAU]
MTQFINYLSSIDYEIYIGYVYMLALIGITTVFFTKNPTKLIAFILTISLLFVSMFLLSDNIKKTVSNVKELEIKNDSLNNLNSVIQNSNDSLTLIIDKLAIRVDSVDKVILRYKEIIKQNKQINNEKIIAIDTFDSDDIDSFFSDYEKRYYNIFIKP